MVCLPAKFNNLIDKTVNNDASHIKENILPKLLNKKQDKF